MGRLDTSMEAEGAEFLVLGQLLIEGVPTYKSYSRNPGYDLISVNPDRKLSIRIQVKSRWATDYDGGFPVRNYDFDFLVFVELNRGFRYRKLKSGIDGKTKPRFFVFPNDKLKLAKAQDFAWGKVFLKLIPDHASYIDAWNLIHTALELNEEAGREHDV